MTAESDALAVATKANWLNVESWNLEKNIEPNPATLRKQMGVVAFDIKVFSDANEDLTSVKLYGLQPEAFTFLAATFTTTHATETVNLNSHGLLDGDGPFYVSTDGVLPAGYTALTPYYIIYATANTFKLAASRALALAGPAVAITSDGTGTHTLSPGATATNAADNTTRLHWYLMGTLNRGSDVLVDVQEGYIERCSHNPLNRYYAFNAGSGVGAQTVTFKLVPLLDEVK